MTQERLLPGFLLGNWTQTGAPARVFTCMYICIHVCVCVCVLISGYIDIGEDVDTETEILIDM